MASKPVAIRFFAPVIDVAVNALIDAVDQKMKQGITDFIILISSPGGSVIHGLSAYNYLKGLPVSITTHNFGSVDSIGIVLYCAGSRRLSVPQARFLLHGVNAQFKGNQSFEEKQLEERLKGLKIDIENIAKVIAANTGRRVEDVTDAMLERTTLNPEEARSWGLVHEIRAQLFEAGTEVISIQSQQQPQQVQKA
ncbi:MAG: ATP-dependent Clp protease proteolytic subunit [Chloroflexi bacterium]|nr:ATP-dependent Clp protease proteolytic subunit [Chloroflexota bacterium]MCK4581369.1 ATP-dependent Clp protease proteolytic subunit [Dehalococcoidia bacterium]